MRRMTKAACYAAMKTGGGLSTKDCWKPSTTISSVKASAAADLTTHHCVIKLIVSLQTPPDCQFVHQSSSADFTIVQTTFVRNSLIRWLNMLTSRLPGRPSTSSSWALLRARLSDAIRTAKKVVHIVTRFKLSTADLTSVVTSRTVVSGGQIEQDRTGGTTPHLLSIYFLLFIKKISWFSSLQYSKF